MFNKIINFIQQSNYLKYFILGFTVACIHSASGHFSAYSWLAVIVSLLPELVKLKFFKDRLSYDNKQQIVFNSLLISSVFWSLYMWTELQDFPNFYSSVFVVLTISSLFLFSQLKNKLAIFLPIYLTFITLLLWITTPAAYATAILSTLIVLFFHFTLHTTSISQNHNSPDEQEQSTPNKMKMVAEIDELKTKNQLLKDKVKQIEINLSAAEMAKMEFLATMSHEIRTPLNGIIPLLDILLDSELSDFQKDYLSTAHISAIQMQKLIDDLLDYSKVEAGKLTVETRGLKIAQLINAVKSSFSQTASKKNISIEIDIHNNVSPLLRGDPTRLRQVLSNLLSNAIKFSSSGTVSVAAKKIKDSPNKEVIRFSVIDKGIGLDKETSENIFLAFTQEDGSSTRKFGGTGLGLAISKKIVELMHGSIAVKSEKGKGSTFYFDLPLLKSVGETSVGLSEASGYQGILVNTNPLLFNKISQKLKIEDLKFQKALGLSQAYEMYASINRVSNKEKNVLIFIDFETAGKQVRSLCNDIASDETMGNLFACILTENKQIAGIPKNLNINLISKNDSFTELLNKIEVSQASLEANKAAEEKIDLESTSRIAKLDSDDLKKITPEVLLVEDNEVNLKVAEKLIQYIGYPFDFAMNGQEALDKVKQNRYRMILMDCQMPVMDGYRCTAKIRDYETAAGLNHTPILAMTANAMMGDKEKCLDAGMDDYMSKPLNRYILEKTLKKWDPLANTPVDTKEKELLKKPTPPVTTQHFSKSTKTLSAPKPKLEINQKWLSSKTLTEVKEFMGDEIIQLLTMFEQESPTIIKNIASSLSKQEYGEIKKMSHMLKSTSANIGANGLSFFSRKMELAAEKEDKMELVNLYNKIRKAYILTSKEIKKYTQNENNSQ